MESATVSADKILKAFPDYGKAPATYVRSVAEVIAAYPAEFHAKFSDVKTGIQSRTKFLPTPYDFAEMAKELEADKARQREAAAHEARWQNARLNAPSEPYAPKQRERYFNARGDEITQREAAEQLAQHQRDVEAMKRVSRTTAYVKHLGKGDSLAGWQIMIERGLSEAPDDWVAQ